MSLRKRGKGTAGAFCKLGTSQCSCCVTEYALNTYKHTLMSGRDARNHSSHLAMGCCQWRPSQPPQTGLPDEVWASPPALALLRLPAPLPLPRQEFLLPRCALLVGLRECWRWDARAQQSQQTEVAGQLPQQWGFLPAEELPLPGILVPLPHIPASAGHSLFTRANSVLVWQPNNRQSFILCKQQEEKLAPGKHAWSQGQGKDNLKLTCKCNTRLCSAKGESRDLLDCNAAVTSRISFCFLSRLFLSGFSSLAAAQVTRSLLLGCPGTTCHDAKCRRLPILAFYDLRIDPDQAFRSEGWPLLNPFAFYPNHACVGRASGTRRSDSFLASVIRCPGELLYLTSPLLFVCMQIMQSRRVA